MCGGLNGLFFLSPLAGVTKDVRLFVHRRIYPFLLVVFLTTSVMLFQGRQFQNLYEKIKNDKLVLLHYSFINVMIYLPMSCEKDKIVRAKMRQEADPTILVLLSDMSWLILLFICRLIKKYRPIYRNSLNWKLHNTSSTVFLIYNFQLREFRFVLYR